MLRWWVGGASDFKSVIIVLAVVSSSNALWSTALDFFLSDVSDLLLRPSRLRLGFPVGPWGKPVRSDLMERAAESTSCGGLSGRALFLDCNLFKTLVEERRMLKLIRVDAEFVGGDVTLIPSLELVAPPSEFIFADGNGTQRVVLRVTGASEEF